ncbi:MAG: hypothetical protein VX644_17420 [Planctomycetota bacterium]|nr:hypothetical protein [Planctomycetota bacterium]
MKATQHQWQWDTMPASRNCLSANYSYGAGTQQGEPVSLDTAVVS